jgi:hypothetical protein
MSKSIAHEFGPVMVPSICSVNVAVQARDAFFPERLVVPSEIAGDFLVTDVKVGRNSQFVSTGCLPAMVFSSRANPEPLSGFDPVGAGMFVTISVTNQSGEDRDFAAAMWGSGRWGRTRWFRRLETLWRAFPRKVRKRYLLGYGSTLVKARGTASINAQPQFDFCPDRLIVPSTIRDSFKILGLSITGLDRAQSGFFECRFSFREKMDPSYLNQPFVETSRSQIAFKRPVCRESFLTVTVENVTDRSANFQAAVAGFVL